VHAAFLTPGRIRTQLSKMPDGTAYFCVARKLVYADGYDLDNLDAAAWRSGSNTPML
jgi:predicted transcriptional regulator